MKKSTTRKVKKIARTAVKRKKDINREVEHAKTLVSELQKLGSMSRDAAHESLNHAKKNLTALYKKVDTGRLKEAQHEFGSYVKKHPLPVMLLAAGSGFLAGWLKKR